MNPHVIFRGLNWDDFNFDSRVWDHEFPSIEITRRLDSPETIYFSEPCPHCGVRLQDAIAEYGCWPLVELL